MSVASTSVNPPIRLGASGVGASLGFSVAWTQPADKLDPKFDPVDAGPNFRDESSNAPLTLSTSLENTDTVFDLISIESCWSIQTSLRIRRPKLGGDVESTELFVNLRGYIPSVKRQVFAMSPRAANGRGDRRFRPAYGFDEPIQ